MIQAIALDADPSALAILETFCQQTGIVAIAQTFTHPSEARQYLRYNPVDLVFMEINLPTESGIDFWQSIRQPGTGCSETESSLPMVIFTTASSEYALISYELQAIDYLLKPFSSGRFAQAVQKASNYINGHLQPSHSQSTTYLLVRIDAGLVRVKLTDIAWIEALSNYLKIHLVDQRYLVVRRTMKAMLSALPATDFVRVHRSYIIPIHRVQSVQNKRIRIGEKLIPLSANYEEEFYALVRTDQPSSQNFTPSSHRQLPLQQAYGNARNG